MSGSALAPYAVTAVAFLVSCAPPREAPGTQARAAVVSCSDSCDGCSPCPTSSVHAAASGIDGADDAEEKNGFVSLHSSDLELTEDSGAQLVGMRFNDLAIPRGATIVNATVQFTVDEVSTDSTDLQIRGEASDDAASFSQASYDLSSRPTTTSRVSWRPSPWSTVGAASSEQQSPNLAPVIQEIIDRPGWDGDASLVLLVDGTGRRTADSVDGGVGPALHVDYINDDNSFCGDGICDSAEGCAACSADCGACPTGATFEGDVLAGSDDAEELDGYMSIDSSDLELVESTVTQLVGIRFDGVEVPRGAVIQEAAIQFTADEISSTAADLTIHAHRTDDAPTFTVAGYDISDRLLTRASASWSPPAWDEVGEAGAAQQTPNLAAVVQEITDRPGWETGQAIAFVIRGSGTRTAESWESGLAAQLVIRYSAEPAVCGDGVCGPAETCSSCSADCGACSTPGVTPDPISHIDCSNARPILTVCSSGGDYSSIQDAIANAPGGARVEVCAGTYDENLVIDAPLCIIGTSGANETIIRGRSIDRTVSVWNAEPPGVTMRGFTVRDGVAGGDGGGIRCQSSTIHLSSMVFTGNAATDGGGVSMSDCDFTIDDIDVYDNSASNEGGGISLDGSNGWLLRSSIHHNRAAEGGGVAVELGTPSIEGNRVYDNEGSVLGGGIYHRSSGNLIGNRVERNHTPERGGGIAVVENAPLLASNEVYDNTCSDDGAGIYLYASQATVSDNIIDGNVAGDDAGGLRIWTSQAQIEGNTFSNNQASDSGGGVKASHASNLFLENTFQGNAAALGGGLELDDDASVVRRCVFRNNEASRGGGLHGFGIAEPYLIDACIFESNIARSAGGAIDLETSSATGIVRFSTLVGNSAPEGAAISTNETQSDVLVRVHSNILFQNPGASTLVAIGQDPVFEFNDFYPSPTAAGMPVPSASDGNIFVDPEFVDERNRDYRLSSGSICIDAADPSFADRDGSVADMGAYGGPESL